jgi:hypothetical protein
MSLQRAYIHIGTGKTGSSTIQDLLADSQQLLLDQGVAFLGRMLEQHINLQKRPREVWQRNGGWPEWLSSMKTGNTADAFVDCLEEQLDALEALGIHTVILSNEGLLEQSSVMQPVVNALTARGVEVDVVAVLRRHYEWAFSAYLQWGVRHKTITGRVLPFRRWLKQRPPRFAPALRAWQECPGIHKLVLVNYTAVPDVVPAFLHRLGIQLPYSSNNAERSNRAASVLEALLLSTYHDHREQVVHPQETRGVLQRLQEQGHVLRTEGNHLWSSCTTADLEPLVMLCRDDLAATNALLEADGQPTFPDDSAKPPQLPSSLTELNLPPAQRRDELLAALLSVVVGLDQQVRDQERQLQELKRIIKQQKG